MLNKVNKINSTTASVNQNAYKSNTISLIEKKKKKIGYSKTNLKKWYNSKNYDKWQMDYGLRHNKITPWTE